MRYAIVIQRAGSSYVARVPDLPGCVGTGATMKEVELRIREAIEFHLEGLREDGLTAPEPASHVEYIDVEERAREQLERVPSPFVTFNG